MTGVGAFIHEGQSKSPKTNEKSGSRLSHEILSEPSGTLDLLARDIGLRAYELCMYFSGPLIHLID